MLIIDSKIRRAARSLGMTGKKADKYLADTLKMIEHKPEPKKAPPAKAKKK